MIKQKRIELIIISLFLVGCCPVSSEETEGGTDVTVPEVIAAVEMGSELSMAGEVPWGFDQVSYEVYKSGALDAFIPSGSSVDQCVTADLDLDGVDDILLCISIPPLEKPDDYKIYEYEMNTMILKGIGQNAYERKAENQQINYHSYYDGSAQIAAGDGWFRFSRARGTAGGYVYSYLFRYDTVKEDWFYAEHYYNKYGYFANGVTMIETPEQFGNITFEDYGNPEQDLPELAESEGERLFDLQECTVDTDGIKISVSDNLWLSAYKDQEKGKRIRELAVRDITYVMEQLASDYSGANLTLSVGYTYSGPDIISLAYSFHGTIEGEEVSRYFTSILDIKEEKRLRLTDLIGADKLNEIIGTQGFSADMSAEEIKSAETVYFGLSEEDRIGLFESADDLDRVFPDSKNAIFCAVYEKSLCFYFQPGQSANAQTPELQLWYIDIDDIRADVKRNCWGHKSEAAVHIEWKG